MFDSWDPANVSPIVAYLCERSCPFTGKVFFVQGGKVQYFQPWTLAAEIDKGERWTVDELAVEVPKIVGHVSLAAGFAFDEVAPASAACRFLLGDLPDARCELLVGRVDGRVLHGEQAGSCRPSILMRPDMKACIAAWASPSTRIALAVS